MTRIVVVGCGFGGLAAIGCKPAVAMVGSIRFPGYPAWLSWLWVHLYFLSGFATG